MKSLFRELDKVYNLVDKVDGFGSVELLGKVQAGSHNLPIYGFEFGSKDPNAPVYGVFGGVHGLEKIGTELAVYFIYNLCQRLEWNEHLQDLLSKVRIISIPLINPAGMFLGTRSNANGVDLMRNSPTRANGKKLPLLSGQSISNKLPWYAGDEKEMEFESHLLLDFLSEKIKNSPFTITMDLHSGFGIKDRLWFPYAKTFEPFPHYDTATKMRALIDDNIKHHIYQIEPTADSYLIEGDLWDYAFDMHHNENKTSDKVFIPWTLEMGSWMWVKKNPLQVFNVDGLFNPYLNHRFKRVMRRHWRLLDLMLHLCANHKGWNK